MSYTVLMHAYILYKIYICGLEIIVHSSRYCMVLGFGTR
jgi:hypothetical protein